jgi:hypothetical protein
MCDVPPPAPARPPPPVRFVYGLREDTSERVTCQRRAGQVIRRAHRRNARVEASSGSRFRMFLYSNIVQLEREKEVEAAAKKEADDKVCLACVSCILNPLLTHAQHATHRQRRSRPPTRRRPSRRRSRRRGARDVMCGGCRHRVW